MVNAFSVCPAGRFSLKRTGSSKKVVQKSTVFSENFLAGLTEIFGILTVWKTPPGPVIMTWLTSIFPYLAPVMFVISPFQLYMQWINLVCPLIWRFIHRLKVLFLFQVRSASSRRRRERRKPVKVFRSDYICGELPAKYQQ